MLLDIVPYFQTHCNAICTCQTERLGENLLEHFSVGSVKIHRPDEKELLNVKKRIRILVAICLVFCIVLTACKAKVAEEPTDPLAGNLTEQEAGKTEENEMNEYPISVQHIRTDGYNEGVKYPQITVVRSTEELNTYYEANKELYSLEHRETVYSDTTIGFLDACDRYNEAFFDRNDLILVLWEEGSGSVRHEIRSIAPSDDHTWVLSGIRKNPEAGTCDMAEWHFMVEIAKNTIKEDDEIILDLSNRNVVGYRYGYAGVELALPDGWEYSIEEYKKDGYTFGISFWPAGQKEGKLSLKYYPNGFGVCGTGLSQVEYTFDNGETAYIGTYDNQPVWDFISYRNTPGDFALINEGAGNWWEEYKEEAVSILHTIQLAEGVIRREEAVEIAAEYCTIEYDMTRAKFDFEHGIWEVSFWISDPPTVGGDQTVVLDARGGYMESKYGE